jgi:hypothetical protein
MAPTSHESEPPGISGRFSDQVRVQPDGTVILSIVGQVPLGFTGVLKINPETEEVILEPHHVVDIAEVCEQLTA